MLLGGLDSVGILENHRVLVESAMACEGGSVSVLEGIFLVVQMDRCISGEVRVVGPLYMDASSGEL